MAGVNFVIKARDLAGPSYDTYKLLSDHIAGVFVLVAPEDS